MAPTRCREPERGSTQQQPAHPSEAENVFQQRLGHMSGLHEVHMRVCWATHNPLTKTWLIINIIISSSIMFKAVLHTVLQLCFSASCHL